MKALLPALLMLCASIAFARIGETLEECQTRYGTMIGTDMTRSDYPAYAFRKDGIEVRIRLHNGKSAQEIFFGIQSELTTLQIRQIEAANLAPDAKAHPEIFDPRFDDAKRIGALGIKVSQVNAENRQYLGMPIQQATDEDPKILARLLDHFGIELAPHPVGINREDGKGQILVITTAEFDRILGGMTGF